MKRILILLILLSFIANTLFSMAGNIDMNNNELVLYIYDSMDWIKKEVIKTFEDRYKCRVKIYKYTDAGSIANRIKLEKKNPEGDIAIGLSLPLVLKLSKEKLIVKYYSTNTNNIKNKEFIDIFNGYAMPFDYGALAILYKKDKLGYEIKTFNDLLKRKKSIIIQNPNTSSTGLDFLLWTIAVYNDKWKEYWMKLKENILTVTSGWSDSYTKFENDEAPIMISYATDGAYSMEYYKSFKNNVSIPEEGAYIQIEGVSIINKKKIKNLAKLWVDFMLTEEFQNKIPLNQWMFPVMDIQLPQSFKYAIIPQKILYLKPEDIEKNLTTWLKEWDNIMK